MKAGELDVRISIETPTVTRDDSGGPVHTWALFAEVYAKLTPLRGRELVAAAQVMPDAEMKFTIRYRTGITEQHRIVHEEKNYDIGHIAMIGRRQGLELLTKVRL